MYKRLTIMYSLPRSMTQWWTWFFAHGAVSYHDPLAQMKHPDKLADLVSVTDSTFIADTSAIFFHDRFVKLFPGHRRLYMLRHPADVGKSLLKQTGQMWRQLLRAQNERLQRHAYGANHNTRLHYGCVEAHLPGLVEQVCDNSFRIGNKLQQRIDVPLRCQYRNDAHVQSLLRYKDRS